MIRHAVVALALLLVPACAAGGPSDIPACDRPEESAFVLAAQAVPSATRLPCVRTMPTGWRFEGSRIARGSVRMWLESDRAGVRAVEVVLTARCETGDAVEVAPAPDEAGTRRFEEPLALTPAYSANRYYLFEGGCISYRFRFAPGAASTLALEADEALSFSPRSLYVERVREEFGVTLCGAGAPPCAG